MADLDEELRRAAAEPDWNALEHTSMADYIAGLFFEHEGQVFCRQCGCVVLAQFAGIHYKAMHSRPFGLF